MIKQGKVYQNVMIDVQPTNAKLVDRACRIISETTSVTTEEALAYLKQADNKVDLAIIMAKTKKDKNAAGKLLTRYHGNVSRVLQGE